MWVLDVYRAGREVAGVCSDLRRLYEAALEYYRTRSPEEIELTGFRECCACAYDDEPLFFTENEPHDIGWAIVGTNRSEESKQGASNGPHPTG